MWFKYVIGVIQMCSMKVYDHGNLTICYELTVCSFKKNMHFIIMLLFTIICKYNSI